MSAAAAYPHSVRSFAWTMRPVAASLLCALVLAVLWLYAPTFFKLNNLVNILVQASTLAVLAVGMSTVMIGGGIDLSLPFNAALSAVLGAMYMRATGDAVGGPLIMVASAMVIGACNGIAVGYLGMIPFVVTLAMMTVTNGAAVWLTGSISIADVPDVFVDPFFARYFGLPLSVIIAFATAGLGIVLMSGTVYGRWLYSVGINARAATVARIPGPKVIALSYVLAGLMAGIAAIMLTGRLASASSNLASPSMVLDVVSACVIGGISIYGGSGRVWGAVLGALFITLLNNALNAAEISLYVNQMIRGAIIVGFVALDRFGARGG
ncbi:ABC transporter permease [Mesorhizobium sp. B283B1A]|uniref:ABC transporter permease n=1 Tax=Mesorhizobium TaxID=68287 RepID=UPI001CD0947A|nr:MULTISPECIES: ABC transporter permease [Mesorhizobium]MCA0049324.1 ABC transporter permease [Mesorhizobium sp. B283B1A]UQS66533.1 ABC transporter permease [Mesorhizobium opportunistum]